MGLYREQLLPRLIDKALNNEGVDRWRAQCIEGLRGVVVEPGFGSGLNVPLYPPEVTKVYAIDPAEVGEKLAADRLGNSAIPVEFVGLDGQHLPLEDNSCDAALLTFTLCTIPDVDRALAELRRVVKPGGRLHFLEHGHSTDPSVATWQRRIEPVQKVLFDGCHLTRPMPDLITGAGFEMDWVEQRYADGPKPWSYFYVGQALNPAA